MVHGPFTSNAPEFSPSQGRSRPSSSTIFSSMPNCIRPCRVQIASSIASSPASASSGVGVAITPSGHVSVMPHICRTRTPYFFLKLSAIARGTAEPPITTRCSLPGVSPVFSRCARYIVQIVGTPPENVTPSRTINSCRLEPSILSHGNTSLQPLIGAANGRPHAVAW